MTPVDAKKVIWMLWYQGITESPLVVRESVASWQRQNPQHEVIVLDKRNLFEYVKPEQFEFDGFDSLSLQIKSDLIRLYLLARYGGVWADATLYCVRPLEQWLCLGGGSFFAYVNPAVDRRISSWLLASREGDYIAATLYAQFRDYWKSNHKCKLVDYHSILNRILSHDRMRRYWFSFPVTKVARVYPYFALHYLFEKLLKTDSEFQAQWQHCERLPAKPAIRLFRHGLGKPLTPDLKRSIDSRDSPVYKLDWKFEPAGSQDASTVLGYLLANA